jgi:hypothetical protein
VPDWLRSTFGHEVQAPLYLGGGDSRCHANDRPTVSSISCWRSYPSMHRMLIRCRISGGECAFCRAHAPLPCHWLSLSGSTDPSVRRPGRVPGPELDLLAPLDYLGPARLRVPSVLAVTEPDDSVSDGLPGCVHACSPACTKHPVHSRFPAAQGTYKFHVKHYATRTGPICHASGHGRLPRQPDTYLYEYSQLSDMRR